MTGLEKFIRNAAAVPLVEATPEDFPEEAFYDCLTEVQEELEEARWQSIFKMARTRFSKEHPVTINQTLVRVESELHWIFDTL